MLRILFLGDGRWAAISAMRLLEDGHAVVGIVGRRRPSDASLSDFASRIGLPFHQPERINDDSFLRIARELDPQITVSFSYDQILRPQIIELAPMGAINCHAGALPHYRGRNVLNWALINNETSIGLTVHHVDEGIDTGDIILQETLSIAWTDTYASLIAKVTDAFPAVLSSAVHLMEEGRAPRTPQAHLLGSYFPARRDGDEWIDWAGSSLAIYNKIRAISHPAPGARTRLGDETVLLWAATYDRSWPEYIATPGVVVGMEPEGIRVKTGDSTLVLNEVQVESGPSKVPDWRMGTRFSATPRSGP